MDARSPAIQVQFIPVTSLNFKTMLLPFSAADEVGGSFRRTCFSDVVFLSAIDAASRPVSLWARKASSCSSWAFGTGAVRLSNSSSTASGERVHIVEDRGEPMQPKQVPGDF